MTYYEELGIESTASHGEIRQAYKHLARLIHPDQCVDDATRRLADLQMKRLHGILGVLLDSTRRERYDRSLVALALAVSGETAAMNTRRWDRRWVGPAATTAAAALLLLLLAVLPGKSPDVAPVLAPMAGAKPAKRSQPARHSAAQQRREHAVEQTVDWEPLVTYAYGTHVSMPALPFPEQLLKPAKDSTSFPQDAPPAKSSAVLVGDWFFIPTNSFDTSGYPPEYIELRLRHEGSTLRGRYQARYRVTDQAISPNVAFQFEGAIGPEGGALPWRGRGGAKGQVTLRLLMGGNLEVKWEADELGNELGLISGTARLIRKVE